MEEAQNHREAVAEAESRIMKVLGKLEADERQKALVWDLLRQLEEHAKRRGMFEAASKVANLYGLETYHPVTARVDTELLEND